MSRTASPTLIGAFIVVLLIVVGTFFFFDILGVFGLPLAIAGLIVAALGSILVYRRSRTADDEP